MSNYVKLVFSVALNFAFAMAAHADLALDQYVAVSGFGTLGAVHSSYDDADFTGNVVQLKGAGYTASWTATPDSDFGVQGNLTLTDALSGVVQVLSRDNADDNFKPDIEWANLKYQFTPDFGLRIGRMMLPTFQRADVQNVGFALPWVRIPLEINYSDSASHGDGAELLYRLSEKGVTQNLEALWGTAQENIPGEAFGTVRVKNMVLSDTLQSGNFSGQVVYQHYEHGGFPPLRQQLFGAGLTYDTAAWFVSGDVNYTKNTYFGGFLAWSVGGGVHMASLTPYFIYSRIHATSAGNFNLPALGNEDTAGAGLRWDFAKSWDMKFQFEQVVLVSVDDTAAFANIQSSARPGDKANVISLTLDFVF
jgi:hypothetical protein